ncbi:glutamine synthetase family [Brachionus plicatilis]|uniref:Glutamine synthetase family n=1 Tax=Brachionus plicatilis TaxID=10195 RepID=A0A3M7Q8R6_BRAPC|nr:glutamine synthetase family [Brachionus plicatilis]
MLNTFVQHVQRLLALQLGGRPLPDASCQTLYRVRYHFAIAGKNEPLMRILVVENQIFGTVHQIERGRQQRSGTVQYGLLIVHADLTYHCRHATKLWRQRVLTQIVHRLQQRCRIGHLFGRLDKVSLGNYVVGATGGDLAGVAERGSVVRYLGGRLYQLLLLVSANRLASQDLEARASVLVSHKFVEHVKILRFTTVGNASDRLAKESRVLDYVVQTVVVGDKAGGAHGLGDHFGQHVHGGDYISYCVITLFLCDIITVLCDIITVLCDIITVLCDIITVLCDIITVLCDIITVLCANVNYCVDALCDLFD